MAREHDDETKRAVTTGGPSASSEHDPSAKTGCSGGSKDSGSQGSGSIRARQRRKSAADTRKSLRYETTGQLGRGGWGVVEQATDRQLQRQVAIKRIAAENNITQDVRERFLHEAKITSQLQHPGIVPVHELEDGQLSGDLYYVMKLLSGQSFRQLIRETHDRLDDSKQRKACELREAILPLLERFVCVCDAIAYAHQQGIIHRDIKPDNIMVGGFGETIVVDWGLAKRIVARPEQMDAATINHRLDQLTDSVDEAISRSDQTAEGSIIGTPAYMPPEQAVGDLERLSPASDVFSLGATLYEILLGTHPHAGLDIKTVLTRVRAGTRTPADKAKEGIPRALSAICETAMAFDPTQRYASAADIANDVRRYIAGEAVRVYSENVFEKTARWCRRNRTLAFSAVGTTFALLVISLVAGFLIHRAHQSELAAHQQTQTAYRETLNRLEQSRRAADAWLIDLSGTLQFYPGLQPVRQELIERATAHYKDLLECDFHQLADGLEGTADGIPDSSTPGQSTFINSDSQALNQIQIQMALERSKLLLRLGDLHRLNRQPEKASKKYAMADILLQETLENSEAVDEQVDNELRLQVANVVVGKLLLKEVDGAPVDQWKTWLDQQLNDADVNSDRPPVNPLPGFVTDLASCRARLSLSLARSLVSQDPAAAAHEAESAVAWSSWLANSRGSFSDRQNFQTSITQHAESLELAGDFRGAATAWSHLVEHLIALQSQSNNRIDYLQALAYARLNWANTLAKHPGDTGNQAAQHQFELAIDEFKNAWQLADADGFYQSNLASAENNLGLLLAAGPPAQHNEAQAHLKSSIEIRKALIREQPSVEEIRLFCQSIEKLAALDVQDDDDQKITILNDADTGYQLIQDYGRLSKEDRSSWANVLRMRAQLHQVAGHKESAIVDLANSKRLEASN